MVNTIALAIILLKHYKKLKKYYEEISKTKDLRIEKVKEFRSIVQKDMSMLEKEREDFYIDYIWSKLLGAKMYFDYTIRYWEKGEDIDVLIRGIEFAMHQVYSAYRVVVYHFSPLNVIFKKVYLRKI
jgi:hypothetical protein